MYSNNKNTARLFVLLIAVWFLLSSSIRCQYGRIEFPYGHSITAYVERVIDGDTFVLPPSDPNFPGAHIRMLGINCPEIARLNKPAAPFSAESSALTKSLIENKKVKLTFDGNIYDVFSRVLAYVWLTDREGKDSLFIQAELLKAGYCHISYYPKGKRYYDLFYNLRRTAIRKKLGIWGYDR